MPRIPAHISVLLLSDALFQLRFQHLTTPNPLMNVLCGLPLHLQQSYPFGLRLEDEPTTQQTVYTRVSPELSNISTMPSAQWCRVRPFGPRWLNQLRPTRLSKTDPYRFCKLGGLGVCSWPTGLEELHCYLGPLVIFLGTHLLNPNHCATHLHSK